MRCHIVLNVIISTCEGQQYLRLISGSLSLFFRWRVTLFFPHQTYPPLGGSRPLVNHRFTHKGANGFSRADGVSAQVALE